MIPATRPTVARYRHDIAAANGETRTHYTYKNVVAWNADGDPLVVGKVRLVPADSWPNFHDVTEAEEADTVATLPGGGWVAQYRDDNGGTITEPVVGWIVRSDGMVTALCADRYGSGHDPAEVSNFLHVYHPEFSQPAPLEDE